MGRPRLAKYKDPREGHYSERGEGRAKKWRVYFDGPNGERLDKKFETRREADTFFVAKQAAFENLGNRIASSLNEDLQRDAYEAQQLLQPFGKTLQEAAQFYRAHLAATAKSAPLGTLAQQFQESMEAAGKSARYLGDLKSRLRPFIEAYANNYATEISTKRAEEWLAGLKVSNVTRNNYRRVISTFFSWCLRLGYCVENPFVKTVKAKERPAPIEVFTPLEMRQILQMALALHSEQAKDQGKKQTGDSRQNKPVPSDVLANIVLCGFAGLRQSEFERLAWEQVKLDRGVIDLSAKDTKTAARRLVKIQPTLRAWLEEYFAFEKGPICRTNFSNRLRTFRLALKVAWKPNALRHSYASYLMEATQSPGEVSLQLGHNNAGVVFSHYREVVTAEEAKEYWSLVPQTVTGDGKNVVEFQTKVSNAK